MDAGADVAFTVKRGKLDFARNADGDFYLDDSAAYSVFTTLFARKGRYHADETVGTSFAAITKDGAVTGTRIRGCVADAAEQLTEDRIIKSLSVDANRQRAGAWVLTLLWHRLSGGNRTESVTV